MGKRFHLIKKGFSGSESRVHLAYDRILGRLVVLKEVVPDSAESSQLISLMRLAHPQLVRYHDLHEVGFQVEQPDRKRRTVEMVLSMDYVYWAGRKKEKVEKFLHPAFKFQKYWNDAHQEVVLPWLQSEVRLPAGNMQLLLKDKKSKFLSLEKIRRVTSEIAGVLDYLHQRGALHGAIQPGNILLQSREPKGERSWLLLLNAGTREPSSTELKRPHCAAYRAPETWRTKKGRDEVGAPSDIYSLGAVLYHLLTGSPLFAYQAEAKYPWPGLHLQQNPSAIKSVRPSELESVDARLERTVMRCLAKDPSERPTAKEILESITLEPRRTLSTPQISNENINFFKRFTNNSLHSFHDFCSLLGEAARLDVKSIPVSSLVRASQSILASEMKKIQSLTGKFESSSPSAADIPHIVGVAESSLAPRMPKKEFTLTRVGTGTKKSVQHDSKDSYSDRTESGMWSLVEGLETSLEKDPGDINKLKKLTKLYLKLKRQDKAIETLLELGKSYEDSFLYQKAIEGYQQVLTLKADELKARLRMADLHISLEETSKALVQLRELALGYEKKGDLSKASFHLKRFLELDSDNAVIRLKLAEVHVANEDTPEAVKEFTRTLQILEKDKKWSDYIRVGERLVYIAPNEKKIIKKLARIHLQQGEPKKAVGKLHLAFKFDAEDAETLELLATSFQLLGQKAKALASLRAFFRVSKREGNKDNMRDACKRILELDPDNEEFKNELSLLPSIEHFRSSATLNDVPSLKPIGDFLNLTGDLSATTPAMRAMPPRPEKRAQNDENVQMISDIENYMLYGFFEKQPTLTVNSPKEIDDLIVQAEIYLAENNMRQFEEIMNKIQPFASGKIHFRQLRVAFLKEQGRNEIAARELLELAYDLTDKDEALSCIESIFALGEDIPASLVDEANQLASMLQVTGE